MKVEIPIPELTHTESHYIEVIDQTKSIIISPHHQKSISSIRLFLYFNPGEWDSFDRLRVKLIRHSDSLPVYEKTYFLIQILNEEIQIPLPYGCQIDDDACVLKLKTDGPTNSVGLWKIGDPPKTGSAQMESLENFTRVSFEKLNMASFLILKIQRSFNFLLLIPPFFLFFFLGWLVFFAINPKAFINENLVIPISLLGLGTFIVYGVLSTFLVNEHKVIRWIFLVSILLLVLLVVFLRKQDDFKSQWTKKTYIFVFLNFFLWFITYILVLAITSHHEVPPWVDGLKHLSIIDSLESGDKQPVLSGYHIGFHLIVLSLHKLLGIPAF